MQMLQTRMKNHTPRDVQERDREIEKGGQGQDNEKKTSKISNPPGLEI